MDLRPNIKSRNTPPRIWVETFCQGIGRHVGPLPTKVGPLWEIPILHKQFSKWSDDCDKALYSLICYISYIHSTLDLKLQSFIGDKITECYISWVFMD